jgi:hypothetical protein
VQDFLRDMRVVMDTGFFSAYRSRQPGMVGVSLYVKAVDQTTGKIN